MSNEAKTYAIEAARGAVAEHLKNHGFEHFKITSTRAFETIFKVSYQIVGNPKISIVIANKDHVEDLRRCITSILEKSTHDNYEIVVVENNSTTKEIFDYYKEIIESYRRAVYDLDIQKLQEYTAIFPKGDAIMQSIELEVL